jgi:two-component system response regulator FixJ
MQPQPQTTTIAELGAAMRFFEINQNMGAGMHPRAVLSGRSEGEMSDSPIVYVIEDDDTARDTLCLLLADEGFNVRTYASATEFLSKVDTVSLGCIVTDVSMPGRGMELLSEIPSRGLALPVVVVTGHADVPLAVRAMKQGAADFLEKPFSAEDLIGAIRRAIAHGKAIQSKLATIQEAQARLATLSVREGEVLDHLIRGQQNKVIAHEMGISERTVEAHRRSIMVKTQARSLPELVLLSVTSIAFESLFLDAQPLALPTCERGNESGVRTAIATRRRPLRPGTPLSISPYCEARRDVRRSLTY